MAAAGERELPVLVSLTTYGRPTMSFAVSKGNFHHLTSLWLCFFGDFLHPNRKNETFQ